MPDDPLSDLPILADPTVEDTLSLVDSLWRWLATSGLRILLILVAAIIVTAVVGWLLRRFFSTMSESSTRLASVAGTVVKRDARAQKAAAARRQQRTETLSNVARNVSRLLIWAIAMVMILSELGVNVAPVIASLGVVGLAAGIGAQTIIKDVVAGVVMLFEDIIAVGDAVDLEYASGTVEGINLRVTQVRALDGTLWTVRNGEIIRIGNMSRGFSNAVITLDIDASADNSRVSTILEEVTRAFVEDADWEPKITGEPSISGILGVDGSRFQRRVMIRATPSDKPDVEQELRRRIRIAFAEAHIPFALPRYQEIP